MFVFLSAKNSRQRTLMDTTVLAAFRKKASFSAQYPISNTRLFFLQ